MRIGHINRWEISLMTWLRLSKPLSSFEGSLSTWRSTRSTVQIARSVYYDVETRTIYGACQGPRNSGFLTSPENQVGKLTTCRQRHHNLWSCTVFPANMPLTKDIRTIRSVGPTMNITCTEFQASPLIRWATRLESMYNRRTDFKNRCGLPSELMSLMIFSVGPTLLTVRISYSIRIFCGIGGSACCRYLIWLNAGIWLDHCRCLKAPCLTN